MSSEAHSISLIAPVVLLAAAVIAVPIFKRIGLGSVLGYLIAGLIIGPFGFAFFHDSTSILHIAELGIVMYLFVIGLEMQPSHLWGLRREIFGLGTLQIVVCATALTGVGLLFGFTWQVAFIGAAGFVLTSTAIVMQSLGDRGDIAQPQGQKIVAILLFEDLLIVPLLAIVAFMAPNHVVESTSARLENIGIGLIAIAGLIAAGYWLLNPLFRLLAAAKAREVMTAAALLVVLGAALLMQVSGLSMAMGAFLAGVLLSESTFRHQIEADIEPFRGLLLGLFFLGVGMSLDLSVVAQNWQLILSGVLAMMFAKALMIYYGDGCRLDILHASGAATAQAIVVCVDSKETTNRIVKLVTHEFPLAKLLVRSYDREHSLYLVKQKVDYMIRETFESAIKFGGVILQELGVDEDEVQRITDEIRERDDERFETEIAADDVYAGVGLQYTNAHPRPTAPLIRPKQAGRILNDEEAQKDLDEK